MKKFALILIVTVVALCLAAPAMAGLKLTTKGYMDVTGITIDGNILDRGAVVGAAEVPPTRGTNDSANSWYQMEMVVNPTLHINDKVRIHGRFTLMERGWGGNTVGTNEDSGAFGVINQNYRGAHNFWWEQLYLSFPLAGGTLYVGRMSGGGWAYPFQNASDNRDRIKYVRKVGHIVLVGLIEKLAEFDGGGPLTAAPAAGDVFDTSHSDVDAYAVGSVIPFSKNIIYKPLFYYIDRQIGGGSDGYTAIFMQGLMIKAGPFKLDTEINYRWTDRENMFLNGATGLMEDWDEGLWSWWADAGVTFGPAEIALGAFFVEGTDSVNAWNNQSLWGIGADFEPLLLLTSEDAGLIWNASGVANGSSGTSGFEAYYLRGVYKISDAMKISAILGYVEAEEMMAGTHWDGVRTADDELGWEFDIGFEWKFMPNIKYVAEFAYLDAGDYWSTFGGYGNAAGIDVANDVWGMRHMLVINW
ncbi:MAG: hypothetical protein JRF53_19595 [Deltaproteobacteria bacterium]|nr:hypothetical protein [Deltaproteobacteria bacterium]